ncbi:MAG: class I SAM-dependent methyltransferase [bacterium]|nr:class I SAM-dependent methyltransferase [Gammaproteobacteria bacterium]HIL97650.1 class I SAM-dependent methyltransferase [Pseudomonadales bacterium]
MSKRQRWNERYANRALVWSAEPNRLFSTEVASLEPGRALDIACGEGRNAIWLAEKGWDVTAVDFSETGIDKGKQIARKRGVRVNWIVEDVSVWQPPEDAYDLVAILYLHTDVQERQKWLTNVIGSVKHGGTLIYIAHDPSNIKDGVGGPQDPDQVPGVAEIKNSLGDFQIEIARVTKRPVENDPGHSKERRGTALDSFVRATRL